MDLIKVGFTNNQRTWKIRQDRYNSRNIDSTVIDVIPDGTIDEEHALHDALKKYKYDNEWSVDCKEVRDIWENYKLDKQELDDEIISEIEKGY